MEHHRAKGRREDENPATGLSSSSAGGDNDARSLKAMQRFHVLSHAVLGAISQAFS
jgi:hypothetical protein